MALPGVRSACAVGLLLTFAALLRADAAGLTVTPIARNGQLLVSFQLNDGFNADVRDAIHSGLSTTFSYQVNLRRGTSVWFDRTIASVSISASVKFDNLTRRYQMSRRVDGRVDDARPTDDREVVRRWMTEFERIPVSATDTLEVNGEYYVRVRADARSRNSWFVWPWDRGAVFGEAKFTFIP